VRKGKADRRGLPVSDPRRRSGAEGDEVGRWGGSGPAGPCGAYVRVRAGWAVALVWAGDKVVGPAGFGV
jgi:hypothetical protein